MEAEYLKRTVGPCLAQGLAEIAAKRPSDPIEYFALWLLKHKQNLLLMHQENAVSAAEQTLQEEAPAVSEAEGELELLLTSGDQQEEEEGGEGVAGDSLLQRSNQPDVAPPPGSPSMDVERPTSKLSRIEEERDEEVASELDPEAKTAQREPLPEEPQETDQT